MQKGVDSAWLVPVSGPPLEPVEIHPTPGGATLGRGDSCAIRVPVDADKVSRMHARFVQDDLGWRVADVGSRWGTFLNGVKLTPHRDVRLAEGDFVRIVPWTFNFSARGLPKHAMKAQDDLSINATMVRSHTPSFDKDTNAQPLAEDVLALLLESATSIHAAETEKALAEVLIDAASRGTGLPNAAVLRPLDASGHVEVIASRQSSKAEGMPVSFSRSLLAAASTGVVAELAAGGGDNFGQSIVSLGITAAMCVPLMVGGAIAAFLYLDSRGGQTTSHAPRTGAAAFCQAIGRMAGLALANLKRAEMEQRHVALEHDLSAAAEAQKWILPNRVTTAGALTCIGESRAGAYVGGDFFDVIPLDANRVAVALGDVSGHGVAASVLMTAAQGFLHAALRRNESLAKAVADLNRFIIPRRPMSSFMTLWVGIFDSAAKQVTYVNAGHGYAMIDVPGQPTVMLDGGEELPIGFDEDAAYNATAHELPTEGRALIVSDGIIEQFGPSASGESKQFGVSGLHQILHTTRDSDTVAAIFDAVVTHSAAPSLQDDATAVLITWA